LCIVSVLTVAYCRDKQTTNKIDPTAWWLSFDAFSLAHHGASFFPAVPEDKIRLALCRVLDTRNHPMLIHCNKGKVSTVKICEKFWPVLQPVDERMLLLFFPPPWSTVRVV
jgi:hypothetical protein